MKYRNLQIRFSIENTLFTVLSISLEKMIRPIPKHTHSKNSFELHYIAEGYGTLIADEKKYTISPGTFFMTGPEVAHEQISDPDEPMTEYGVYLQTKQEYINPDASKKKYQKPDTKKNAISSFSKEEGNKNATGPVSDFLKTSFWIGTAENGMYGLMKKIISELEQKNYGYELMLPPLLQQLVLSVSRLYRINRGASEAEVIPVSPNDLIYLTIEEAFLYDYKDLTLEKLASKIYLGPRQTERLLKKHYNKTFLQKKTEARMSAAGLLLQNSDKSISVIAEELGYSSAQHFSNAFNKYYNQTPANYRKQ